LKIIRAGSFHLLRTKEGVETVSKTRIDERFRPEKYGMIFCPGCSGSGKSITEAMGTNVCKVCGGFGLIKKEEKKASRAKGVLIYRLGEFALEQT
jgi:rRNA maturation endonuclease Nob1